MVFDVDGKLQGYVEIPRGNPSEEILFCPKRPKMAMYVSRIIRPKMAMHVSRIIRLLYTYSLEIFIGLFSLFSPIRFASLPLLLDSLICFYLGRALTGIHSSTATDPGRTASDLIEDSHLFTYIEIDAISLSICSDQNVTE